MLKLLGGTDTGLVRESNQDQYEIVTLGDTLAFAVLCDGMGGQNGGNVASETTTAFICDMLRRDLKPDMTELSIRSIIGAAVAGANALVFERAQAEETLKGMGTTLIVAVFSHSMLYIGYVGDSRVYLVTQEAETQLTRDHTVVQMLVDIGEISESDAQSHPKRHFITRAVGVAAEVEVDYLAQELAPGDYVLLCSDGMYHYLEPGTMRELIAPCLEQQDASPLIHLARERGGADNITVIVAVRD